MAKIHAKTYSQMLQDHDLFIHQLSLTPSDKHHDSLRSVPTALPNDLVRDIFKLPKLTREQCGHLRHFHNLASQPDGDWSFMGGASGQDHDEGSYRYQLASMAYAAGAAHYHRLPALRSVFQALLQKMIRKMLHPEVWSYWYLTSQSGKRLDPDLKQLRRPWADPVRKENVMVSSRFITLKYLMVQHCNSLDSVQRLCLGTDHVFQYSGHLLLMVSLYSMLFGDDHFDQKDGIIFNWDPMFWGMGPERFSYNRTTLQGCILKQMERSGWMGACCEPNMVFIVCNQFPVRSSLIIPRLFRSILTSEIDHRNEIQRCPESYQYHRRGPGEVQGGLEQTGRFHLRERPIPPLVCPEPRPGIGTSATVSFRLVRIPPLRYPVIPACLTSTGSWHSCPGTPPKSSKSHPQPAPVSSSTSAREPTSARPSSPPKSDASAPLKTRTQTLHPSSTAPGNR